MAQNSRFSIKTGLMAIGAIALMGLGIIIYVYANVGVGSWDVLHASLAEYYPSLTIGTFSFELTIGRWIMIVGVITVFVSQLIHRNPYYFLSILVGIVQGYVTDFWEMLLRKMHVIEWIQMNVLTRWLGFAIAINALGFGISLLIRSKFPPTPIDTLTMGLFKRLNLKFSVAKYASEAIAFMTVFILNIIHGKPFNNMGIGTILSLLMIGKIVAWSDAFWVRVLRLENRPQV